MWAETAILLALFGDGCVYTGVGDCVGCEGVLEADGEGGEECPYYVEWDEFVSAECIDYFLGWVSAGLY